MVNPNSFNNGNSGDDEKSPENARLRRQQDKLAGFYLSNGNTAYIFQSDKEQYSERNVTEADRDEVLNMMRTNKVPIEMERNLLASIKGPYNYVGQNGIFSRIQHDKQQKRILGYMTGMRWGEYDYTSGDNVHDFLQIYPTPIDFEVNSRNFLQMIYDYNGEKKAQEYVDSMEEFKRQVYGKKYEYYEAMRELHREAMDPHREAMNQARRPREDYGKFGKKSLEAFNRPPVVRDFGVATVNRGQLIGYPDRQNEDASYSNAEAGVFAVFDGAGGMANAAEASGLARDLTAQMVHHNTPETAEDLANILTVANKVVIQNAPRGCSTAVIGKIVEKSDGKVLEYASVGDSRIYVVRSGRAFLITRDEGHGNIITNALGSRNFSVRQTGEIPLLSDDRIVFCTDGITGDFEKDFIPEGEFVRAVGRAPSAEAAAHNLTKLATKVDDRTAIVVEVA